MKYEIWKEDDEYGNEHYVCTVRAESAESAETIYCIEHCSNMSDEKVKEEMSLIYARLSDET